MKKRKHSNPLQLQVQRTMRTLITPTKKEKIRKAERKYKHKYEE